MAAELAGHHASLHTDDIAAKRAHWSPCMGSPRWKRERLKRSVAHDLLVREIRLQGLADARQRRRVVQQQRQRPEPQARGRRGEDAAVHWSLEGA